MEESDIVKNSWKPKFTAEFSMGQYDYARLDKTLTLVDNLAANISSTDLPTLELMQQYFAQLKNLYDNFRPIISNAKITQELDEVVREGKRLKRFWEGNKRSGMPTNKMQVLQFVDIMDAFKTRLYDLKQTIGLGVQVKRNMTTAEKIRQGVHGNKDFGNLPEA